MSRLKNTAKRVCAGLAAAAMLVVASACGTESEMIASGAVIDKEIYISEFMASNSSAVTDADGEYSDWIEIHNATDRDYVLTGATLTDDEKKPTKWTFPETVLPAGGYIVVFASGKNKDADGELHTNFSLAAGGERIIFSSAGGKVLSDIEYGKQTENLSSGVVETGDGRKLVTFQTPTPGAENGGSWYEIGEISSSASFDLAINEITPRGAYSLYTLTGSYEQWVEIINKSDKKVNASDYYLSDDSAKPLKYCLPSLELEPGALLVVFLTGEGTYNAEDGEYQANFSISAEEKAVYLFYKNGAAVDTAEIPDGMRKNNSYGRSVSDFEKWVFYSLPTPGKVNDSEEFESLSAASSLKNAPLSISEVSTANVTGLQLTNASYIKANGLSFTFERSADWVELYNNTNGKINLADYLLGDKNALTKGFKELPDYTMAPGEYKIIFVGLKSDYYDKKSGEIGLSLGLNSAGDMLFLVGKQSGAVVDFVNTGRQFDYLTVGRKGDDPEALFFTKATPGAENKYEGVSQVSRLPEFSINGGHVEVGTEIAITSPAKNAKIYYTTDGTLPNASSKEYTGPVKITENIAIRAVAVEEGRLVSVDVARTFFTDEPHNIAVMSIVCDPDDLYGTGGLFSIQHRNDDGFTHGQYMSYILRQGLRDYKFGATIEYYAKDRLSVDFDAEISLFGNYSLITEQKSLKVELKNKYGTGEINYPFIPGNDVTNYNALVLRTGGYPDVSRTKLMDLAFAKLVKYSPLDLDVMDGVAVAVYINGKYHGFYNLRERFDADYLYNHYGIEQDNVDIQKGNWTLLHGTTDTYRALKQYVTTHDLSVEANYEYVCSQVDIDSLINWWCVECYLVNTDSGNIKYYRDRVNGKWRWFLFDLDWSLFGSNYKDEHYDMVARFCFDPGGHGVGNGFETWLMCGLVKNSKFKDLFIHRYVYVATVVFGKERSDAMVDMLAGQIRDEIPRNAERWKGINNEYRSSPGSLTSWESNLKSLKYRIDDRRSYALKDLQRYFRLSDAQLKHYLTEDENGNPLVPIDIYGNPVN